MRDAMLMLAVFAVIPMGITRPFISVAFWAYLSLLDPNFFLYGFAAGFPFVKLGAALTAISFFCSRDTKYLPRDRTSILVVTFLAIAAVSQFTALSSAPLGWELLDKLWKIAALYLLVVCFMRTRLRIHLLVLTICLGICFNGVGEALKYLLSAGGHKVEGTPSWGDNNQVAMIVLMTMPLIQYVREVSQDRFVRMAMMGVTVFFVICVVATASRGGLAGLVILALAGISTSRHKIRYLLAMVVAGVILVKTAPDSWTERMDTLQAADQDSSFMGRVVVWKLSTLIALDHPFFGAGLHGVQAQDVWSAYVPSFDRLSFIPTDPPDLRPHAAHSIYFEVLGDTGFLGLLVFLSIVGSSILASFRIKRITRDRPDLAWAGRLTDSLRLCMITFLVTGAALSAAYHDLVFLLFAMFSAVRATVEAAPAPQPVEAMPSQVTGWRARRLNPPAGGRPPIYAASTTRSALRPAGHARSPAIGNNLRPSP